MLYRHKRFESPEAALRAAIHLGKSGQFAEAAEVLRTTLTAMPPAMQCQGEAAHQWFYVLALLSDMIRKGVGDAEDELAVLTECATLAEHLPPAPPGPDPLVNLAYQIHMNRGNAAGRTGQHARAEQAYAAALAAARDSEIQCKCLAYQGWAVLRQQERSKLPAARACFDRFARICETVGPGLAGRGRAVSPALVSSVWLGRAVLHLYDNDLPPARRACERSLEMAPELEYAHHLLELLRRPGVTATDGLRWVLAGRADAPPGESPGAPLSPLPEGI